VNRGEKLSGTFSLRPHHARDLGRSRQHKQWVGWGVIDVDLGRLRQHGQWGVEGGSRGDGCSKRRGFTRWNEMMLLVNRGRGKWMK
jgi:hypothetical protein